MKQHTFRDLRVQAFRPGLVEPPPLGFRGGPVILDPEWQALRHTRYGSPVDQFETDAPHGERLAGSYVYAGPVYDHFGHVMAEMVHRLLDSTALLEGRRLLMVGSLGTADVRGLADLPRFLQEVLSFFGVTAEKLAILNRDAVVEELTVVEQGSDLGGGPKAGYLERLGPFAERLLARAGAAPRGFEKLYVSRSALPGGGGVLGERYIESLFAAQGYQVIRPETLSVLDQMRLYGQARVSVFPEGSACHGLELLGAGALGAVAFIPRREDHTDIFSQVLRPRAVDFLILPATLPIGPILRTWHHLTLSMFDVERLFAALQARGLLGPVKVDVNAYIDACETDFMRHVRYFVNTFEDLLDPGLIASAHRRIAKLLTDCAARGSTVTGVTLIR